MSKTITNLNDAGIVAQWVQGVGKSGKPYAALQLLYPNGYSETMFLERPLQFMTQQIIDDSKKAPKVEDKVDESKSFLED